MLKQKYFLAGILFYRLKTADKIVVAENRMITSHELNLFVSWDEFVCFVMNLFTS